MLSLGPTFRVGLGGVNAFVGTVIAFVLTLCGLLLWFSPAQRVFYSIVAVILALATFNTINYGGFFIGMLLGIIGGALAFAWSPVAAQPAAPEGREADGTDDRVNAQAGNRPGPGVQAGRDRLLGIAALPLSLPLLLGAGWQAQRAAAAPQSGPGCILIILCPSPRPTPSPSATPSPSPTGSASLTPGAGQTPTPSTPPAAHPAAFRGQQEDQADQGAGRAGGRHRAHRAHRGLGPAGRPCLRRRGRGTAGVGRPVPMMKFTLQSVTLTGSPTLTIHQNASVATTRTSLLSFTGSVALYATKLSGNLLGIPVTLTPSSPLSLVLRLLGR